MIITARINNEKNYNLSAWNAQEFNASLILEVQSIDLRDVSETFRSINKLEIFTDGALVATYTSLDTYSQIVYVGKVFVPHENIFADTMRITLTKTNIVDQINRIDEQINPVIDLDGMTLEELRNYKLGKVSEKAQKTIFDGQMIQLTDGTIEHFSYKMTDQENLNSMFNILVMNPDIKYLAWHSDANICRLYTRRDILIICTTLLLFKTREITYANALNMYIRALTDREALMNVDYGMDLPQEYQDNINTIMASTMEEVSKMIDQIIPPETEQTSEETNE